MKRSVSLDHASINRMSVNASGTHPMTVEMAMKALEFGFLWGCDRSENVNKANISEKNVLQAFRAEVCMLGEFSVNRNSIF